MFPGKSWTNRTCVGDVSPVLVPALPRGDVYDVIESKAVSIPTIEEAALAAFRAAVGFRAAINTVDFAEMCVRNFNSHVSAEIGVRIPGFESLGRGLVGKLGEFAVGQQFEDTTKIGATITGEAAETFYGGFFLAVAVEIGIENWREALQRLLAVAAIGL